MADAIKVPVTVKHSKMHLRQGIAEAKFEDGEFERAELAVDVAGPLLVTFSHPLSLSRW